MNFLTANKIFLTNFFTVKNLIVKKKPSNDHFPFEGKQVLSLEKMRSTFHTHVIDHTSWKRFHYTQTFYNCVFTLVSGRSCQFSFTFFPDPKLCTKFHLSFVNIVSNFQFNLILNLHKVFLQTKKQELQY